MNAQEELKKLEEKYNLLKQEALENKSSLKEQFLLGHGSLETRIARLETIVEHTLLPLRKDIYRLWAALITSTLGLAALIAHGFKWF